MDALRHLFFHHWFLKLFSLGLAFVLWVTIAGESTSEIGLEVPLEYRNIPVNSEIVGDSTNTVEVHLRGPSRLIRDMSPQDISTTIDLAGAESGERVVGLTPQNIRLPFGIEVVRVTPARVRLVLEPTISKVLPIVAAVVGEPGAGFRVNQTSVTPTSIEIQGPINRVQALERVSTMPVDIAGKTATVHATVELDPADPLVRIPQSGSARVDVVIGPDLSRGRKP